VLIDDALALLAGGPADSQTIVRRVCQIPEVAAPLAEHLAIALLGADDRFGRGPDGRWRRVESMDRTVTMARVSALADTPFAVVDVETTGSNTLRGDRITEVAVVRVAEGRAEVVFDTLVNPERPIPAAVTRITSITSEMVRTAPRFGDIVDQLAGVLEGHVFVAHNAGFDWRFVDMEMRRALGRPLVGRRLCTVRLARWLLPSLRRRSLDHLALHYGVRIHPRHRAGGDAIATADIFIRLLDEARSTGCASTDDLHRLGQPRGKRRRKKRTARPTPVTSDDVA
jgi:DNA polymerase-3 subunit epsilon